MLLDKKLLDTLLEINKKFVEYSNERWITIKPHGDDSDDYRRLKLEDDETPKEAIDRVYKKKDKKQAEEKGAKQETKSEAPKKEEQPKSDYETKKQAYHDAIKARNEKQKEYEEALRESGWNYKMSQLSKELTKANTAITKSRKAYAEQIMADFQHSDDTSFEDRQQARKERYEEKADKFGKERNKNINQLFDRIHQMPLGQPNVEHRLDGWYKRNEQLDRKASRLDEKADYYEHKAKGVGKAGISSDDANAIEKLAEKYAKTSSSAERRRIIDRVIAIDKNRALAEKQAKEGTQETSYKGFKAVRNAEANRLQLHFDDIPTAEHRSILKSNGFRWSPSNKAWQRQLGTNSEYALERVAKALGQ